MIFPVWLWIVLAAADDVPVLDRLARARRR